MQRSHTVTAATPLRRRRRPQEHLLPLAHGRLHTPQALHGRWGAIPAAPTPALSPPLPPPPQQLHTPHVFDHDLKLLRAPHHASPSPPPPPQAPTQPLPRSISIPRQQLRPGGDAVAPAHSTPERRASEAGQAALLLLLDLAQLEPPGGRRSGDGDAQQPASSARQSDSFVMLLRPQPRRRPAEPSGGDGGEAAPWVFDACSVDGVWARVEQRDARASPQPGEASASLTGTSTYGGGAASRLQACVAVAAAAGVRDPVVAAAAPAVEAGRDAAPAVVGGVAVAALRRALEREGMVDFALYAVPAPAAAAAAEEEEEEGHLVQGVGPAGGPGAVPGRLLLGRCAGDVAVQVFEGLRGSHD